MTSTFKEKLMPRSVIKQAAYENDAQKYEGVKAQIAAEFSLVEGCLGKCAVAFDGNALSATEAPCMVKCFNKYFDSSLLVDKELNLYTHGNPYV